MEKKTYENGYKKFLAEMKNYIEEQEKSLENKKADKEDASTELKEMQHKVLCQQANQFAQYIKKECEQNPDFNKQVLAEWKSVERMMKYVRSQAQKLAVNGCACVPDDIVYDWINDYFFLDDKEEIEAEARKEAERKAKAEAEAKAKAEREAMAKEEAEKALAENEAYQAADDKEKGKILKAEISRIEKKIEKKQKADAKKAEKAAEERAKALKRLEEAGSLTSTSDAEKEKMIEQTIKKIRKEEREAKKQAKETKTKAEAKPEAETKVEATSEAKAESTDYGKLSDKLGEPDCKQVAEYIEKYGEAKTVSMTEPSLLDKAKALLAKCDADKVVALYKKSSVEDMTERELDNLVSHEEQVLAKFALA